MTLPLATVVLGYDDQDLSSQWVLVLMFLPLLGIEVRLYGRPNGPFALPQRK